MAKIKQNTNLNESYDLLFKDLFNKLSILKKDGVIKLGSLGTFTKKYRIQRNNPLTGKTYAYYHIGFKASSELKKELDKRI
jgi:nucleoid DNA-binding protein